MSFRDVIEKDFDAMLTSEFSEEFTVTTGPDSVLVQGVFDSSYQTVDPESNAIVMSTKPRVTFPRTRVPFQVHRRSTVTARGKTYQVREPQPDGEGSMTLYLD